MAGQELDYKSIGVLYAKTRYYVGKFHKYSSINKSNLCVYLWIDPYVSMGHFVGIGSIPRKWHIVTKIYWAKMPRKRYIYE